MRISSFTSDDGGAAAIEFAFVLPVVIGLITGTFEVGLVALASNTLDNSVQAAARTLRVNEPGAANTNSEFKTKICSRMFESQATCLSKLNVSVRTFAYFAQAKAAAGDTPAGEFAKGTAGDIVMVKATYTWPFFMPFFTLGFQQAGPGSVLIDQRTTFKNEPYT